MNNDIGKTQNNPLDVKYESFFSFVNQNTCCQKKRGYYVIPNVQRQFVWKHKLYQKIVNKLLEDKNVIGFQGDVKNTFLGYILLYNDSFKNIKTTKIIDGQQRLITFTLILHSLRSLLLDLKRIRRAFQETIETNLLKELFDKCKKLDDVLVEEVKNIDNKLIRNTTFNDIDEAILFMIKWVEYFLLLHDTNKASLLINSKDENWLELIKEKRLDEKSKSSTKGKIYIDIVFHNILSMIKDNFEYDKNKKKQPNIIIDELVNFILAMIRIKFVVTSILNSDSFDSEYSMFINLNARRQNLAPYDIIKGYMLGKMDELNIDTRKINKRGRNLDRRIFNIMFAKHSDDKEKEFIKNIYYDVDDSYKDIKNCWSIFLKDFQNLKIPYISGEVTKEKDVLSVFFETYYSYYTGNFRENNIDITANEWVEKPSTNKKPKSERKEEESYMKVVSNIIKDKISTINKAQLWSWPNDPRSKDFDCSKFFRIEEENNLVRLFYAFIRTFSKSYFNKVFGITNYWILKKLTETPFLKPEILRIILSILDENLKIDKDKVQDAAKVLELIVWYYAMYNHKYPGKTTIWANEISNVCSKDNRYSINKYGFWKINLKGYIMNLQDKIGNKENRKIVFDILKDKSNANYRVIQQMYPLFLSRFSSFHIGENKKKDTYKFSHFIPFKEKTRILKLLKEEKGWYTLDLSDTNTTSYIGEYQIGNFFYLKNAKSIELKISKSKKGLNHSLDSMIFTLDYGLNYKSDLSLATKEFLLFLKKAKDDSKISFTWDLFSTRTENIIKELEIWLDEICS